MGTSEGHGCATTQHPPPHVLGNDEYVSFDAQLDKENYAGGGWCGFQTRNPELASQDHISRSQYISYLFNYVSLRGF